jgi:hypothetical protein
MANKFLSGINVTGTTTLNTVANAGTDTDKFLVLDASGNVDFRTGDELYADLGIGSLPAGSTSTLKHAVKAGVAISKGQAVYVTSADGTNMIVGKASNASEATSSKTIGLIETSLLINGIGNVITEGLLAGLDTTGATNAGDPVWLGTDGNLIYGLLNKPYAPAHLVFIGIVTRINANNGEIFVKVQNGFELNEIHDIDLKTTTPINGHILGYNGTLWVNKTIAGWLGYTPADDSSVVKLSGAQTVGGLKTFSASIIANIGVLLKNGAVSSLSGYTAIGGSSSNNGIDIATDTSGYTQSLLFQTGASYAYTFPAATGTVALTSNLSAYVPTSRTITINGTSYDLSADRSWTVTSMVYPSAGIAVSTGTAWGTSITDNSSNWNTAYGWGNHASAGYVPGARELTINGTTYDLTANRSWTIDATSVSTRTIQKFTSTASQTTFTITGGYTVGMVDVWVNGVKLDNATEFTASNGTTVVLAAGLTANQIVEVYKYGSQFIANNALRQKTLFTATAGQTTFTVAYSVGLVDVFYNGSKLDDSEYTATNGTSIVFGTACAVNDKVEVIAYSYNVNGFTGIGGSGTTNYIPKFTASGTIGNSVLYNNGTNIGIGLTTPVTLLEVLSSQTNSSIKTGGLELQSYAADNVWIGANNFYNGGDFYRSNGAASKVQFASGGIYFKTASAGTAGAALTFNQPMAIFNNGSVQINGPVYRYSGQTVIGGSFVSLTALDLSSSRTYLIQMMATNVEANLGYRIFGVIQANATSGSYAFSTIHSQTMEITFSGTTVQARVTNGQQFTFNWSIIQLL